MLIEGWSRGNCLGWSFIFLISWRVGAAQPACGFQGLRGIYRFWQWDLNSCVQETPAPWRCTWHFKWCKSVELKTPNSVWMGINMAGNQMTLPSGPSVCLPSPPVSVYKPCSGLYLSSVLTKPWYAPSPSGFIADKSNKCGALFFPSFVTKSCNENYQDMTMKGNQRNGKSLSEVWIPGCCFL